MDKYLQIFHFFFIKCNEQFSKLKFQVSDGSAKSRSNSIELKKALAGRHINKLAFI